jgi:hypothetical protein
MRSIHTFEEASEAGTGPVFFAFGAIADVLVNEASNPWANQTICSIVGRVNLISLAFFEYQNLQDKPQSQSPTTVILT